MSEMNLRDLSIAMENALIKNNISWRYVSSKDCRTLVLEDGTATVLTLRYARDLDNYIFHITSVPSEGIELISSSYIIYDTDTLVDKINRYASM